MILAIDIGNTKIKSGIFKNNKLINSKNSESAKVFFEEINFYNQFTINNFAISSVVPNLTKLFNNPILLPVCCINEIIYYKGK